MNARRTGLLLVVGATALLGCGSDHSSGIPRDTLISALTPEQAGILCDFSAEQTGGYGRSVACSSTLNVSTSVDRDSCVQQLPQLGESCPSVTVGDEEDCAKAMAQDLCELFTADACKPIFCKT